MFTLHQISFSFHYIHVLAGWLYRFTWLRPAERKQATCSDAGAAHTQKTQSTEGATRTSERTKESVREEKNARTENQIKNTFFSRRPSILFIAFLLRYNLHKCIFQAANDIECAVHVYRAPDPMSAM